MDYDVNIFTWKGKIPQVVRRREWRHAAWAHRRDYRVST
jgi:hypothetical protein